jgi:inner membrane protein
VGWLLGLAYAGVYSHVFLDFLNNYGVRLLTPFDWRWFYGDAVFIIDPWLWLTLGVGVWLSRRGRTPAPARRALVVAAVYILAMLVSARLARVVVIDAWRQVHGTAPRALMVGPVPVSPLSRSLIVDAGDRYYTGTFSWWPREVLFDEAPVLKHAGDPLVAAARTTSSGVRAFLVWSRFPYWTLVPDAGGTRVTVSDMRFTGAARFAESVVVPTPAS